MSTPAPDFEPNIRDFLKLVFGQLSGLVTSGMIYLGHHLGLYRAVQDRAGHQRELAQQTGLHERWVREWLRGQAAARLIDYDGDGRFQLSAGRGIGAGE